jgi:hypothetical protein
MPHAAVRSRTGRASLALAVRVAIGSRRHEERGSRGLEQMGAVPALNT